MQFQVILFFCIAVFFNALANILIKTSSMQDKQVTPGDGFWNLVFTVFNPYFIAGLASFGLALLGYRYVLGKGLKLSLAYPVFTSSGFIIVLIASSVFFKERLNFTQWLGISFILVGVWLTALQMFDVNS
ncbi:cation transporter [Leptospira biflexa]|jgi:multidrug transporter EmrE-like cation transporter|uniref:Putative transporter putative membrane protein n=1 Tax=Leptospira biflexa serovar Patoc (strain Patoc 1 / ATCC 23582 / Paris) TaxID=456481 RepID=B0SNW7_LEPBP|nr:SMR family transporter [Leptospira biflexa]ABZ95288.1 Cation transporter protein [Leptospira biflexa serovar Patoc strain 'Patoc 1 (Ames)']ABZ98979.1 Putative transporter; putative membrane protein [Leptospira biflexa serovar Patoc strain 'Patoc 1 (Paris)']TGM31833.1 cation transporter [Leptospira biflexa]TGM36975.1 cation transporter [Leptospira biflexa]TGM46519.1 cation transporter [Leptospira biflexa]